MVEVNKKKRRLLLCFFLLCIAIVCFSCKDTSPVITSVKHFVVYDYTNEMTERLAVYVQLDSDLQRLDTITLLSPNPDFSWIIEKPQSIKNTYNNETWTGSSNIRPIQGNSLEKGEYQLIYTDVASRKTRRSFMLEDILSAEELDKNTANEVKIVAYDKEGTIIYYGDDDVLQSKKSIQDAYPEADVINKIYIFDDVAFVESLQ